MQKTAGELLVVGNTQLNHDNYLIILQPEHQLINIVPGQFVNILVKGVQHTFLRRPFSIHDVDYLENTFSVLVKTVGEGTQKLSEVKKGELLDIVYPLGNGFKRPKNGQKILLVGGGVGIAPMMHMAKESKAIGAEVTILLGARSERDHILLNEFSGLGELYLTTNDGTMGTKGFVTDHEIISGIKHFDRIYCCGPDPMMHAVAKKAVQIGVDCEVSLENMMACGYGVCLCCVTKTTQGHKCVCTDGPVFNIKELQWQI